MDKEAVLLVEVYLQFDSTKITEQQALDKVEEAINELEEKHALSVIVHKRNVKNALF